MIRPPPRSTLFPTRRSSDLRDELRRDLEKVDAEAYLIEIKAAAIDVVCEAGAENDVEVVFADNEVIALPRSEEHTSELQSQSNLVCRLLLEKKKKNNNR